MKKGNKTSSHKEIDLDRRKALKRLGLAASAVYAAPVLMTLSQSTHAASTPSEPSVASAPSAPSGISSPSGVSEPSGASSPSGPSGPSSPDSSASLDDLDIITDLPEPTPQ